MVEQVIFGEGAEDFQQAEWLADQLGGKWRFDHTSEKWHHWDGVRWAPDQVNAIYNEVASLAARSLDPRDSQIEAPRGDQERKARIKLMNVPSIVRVLTALATLPGYGTNGDDWDSTPWLLGCANGIVDLRENALVARPTPEMLVTHTTRHNFKPVTGPADFDQRAPQFMEVMREWMSGDESMVAFLLLWFGASLFGFTPEQRFLLMTGIGRNGKGALKHSVLQAVGEYGEQFDSNLYMRSKYGAARADQARADLIALKGKRITFFSEPEGGKFNDEMLKAHTGGDRITARALHSNNMQTWDPTHSITFLVNNAPEVEDLGPSMGSRVMVADFRERYDGDKEDKLLYGKLGKEADGILAILCWAAAAWYASWSTGDGGITLPERVVEQSKQFMERNDQVANWLNERGEYGRDFHCPSQHAYDSYLNWFSRSGEPGDAHSMVKWALMLQKKGFTKRKTPSGMVWSGFRILGAMELADKGIDEDETP